MGRLQWLLVPVVLALAGLNWHLSRRLGQSEQQAEELQSQVTRLQGDLKKERQKNQAELHGEEVSLESLTRQSDTEKQEIDRLTGRLITAENLSFDHGYRNNLETQRSRHQATIQTLEAQLIDTKKQEANIVAGGKQAVAATKWNQRSQSEDLAGRSRDLQAKILAEKTQIAILKARKFDFSAQQSAVAMESVRANDERALAQLKADRGQSGAEWETQRRLLEDERQVTAAGVRKAKKALQEGVQEEKAAIKSIDQQLGTESKSEKGRNTQLSQLREGIQRSKSRVIELEGLIHEEEAKISRLRE